MTVPTDLIGEVLSASSGDEQRDSPFHSGENHLANLTI
jgi:hypothetical protein